MEELEGKQKAKPPSCLLFLHPTEPTYSWYIFELIEVRVSLIQFGLVVAEILLKLTRLDFSEKDDAQHWRSVRARILTVRPLYSAAVIARYSI